MCPSYRATREERYSTRGRSRLLAEMLRGEIVTEGWASDDVKEALDWCLACKGCRSDCPTHTDMAAYKAEFMSHYYEKRARPLHAQLMGRIGEWAPYASRFSSVVNAFSGLGKGMAGISSHRTLPRFSNSSFRSEFKSNGAGERVILFDDTFNNHFRPQTARAAQRVLEAAGCAVELPREHLCCGRPYYDFGMLERARAALQKAMDVLPENVPVVMLEPGCLSVFRDELKQLFPDDPKAKNLQVYSLAEFLQGRRIPEVKKQVLVHGHCHQKALFGMSAELEALRRAGCEVSAPETGCCGMAGAFGYRAEFYEASRRIAELGILPALAKAPERAVLANGFSCREQIEALAQRPTLHLAELLAEGLES